MGKDNGVPLPGAYAMLEPPPSRAREQWYCPGCASPNGGVTKAALTHLAMYILAHSSTVQKPHINELGMP